MNTEQRKFTYTNEDGSTIDLVAELQGIDPNPCAGCVGQHNVPSIDVPDKVCSKLPNCPGIIWKEAV